MSYNQYAGPIKESEPLRAPKDPPQPRLKLDSYKYLIRKSLFPDALEPTTIISFKGWQPEEMKEVRRLIIASSIKEPGNLVTGSRNFPDLSSDRLLYFLAAGFSQADAEFLSK